MLCEEYELDGICAENDGCEGVVGPDGRLKDPAGASGRGPVGFATAGDGCLVMEFEFALGTCTLLIFRRGMGGLGLFSLFTTGKG